MEEWELLTNQLPKDMEIRPIALAETAKRPEKPKKKRIGILSGNPKNLSRYQTRASFGSGGESAALPLRTNVPHCLVAAPCIFAARTKTRFTFDNGTGSKNPESQELTIDA